MDKQKGKNRKKMNYVDSAVKSPALLALCPGSLALERGIARVIPGVQPVLYVEIEAFAIENMVQQMEQGVLAPTPIWSDVKTFLPIANQLRGKVDIVSGGYPCQPFSHVGRQRGVDDPRHIWPYIGSGEESIIGAIRPVCCFFENVSNHLNIGYKQVRSDLHRLDYTVKEGIYSAEEVGASHIRKRLFFLAVDNTLRRRYGRSKEEILSGWITAQSSEEVAYSNGLRESQPSRTINEGIRWIEYGGEDMDNSFQPRLEGHARNESRTEGREEQTRSVTKASFPLGQGYEQWEWERPRVESRMGFSVNGYNYREDLLRMAGNAVVEQTAELAFRDLLRKHGIR